RHGRLGGSPSTADSGRSLRSSRIDRLHRVFRGLRETSNGCCIELGWRVAMGRRAATGVCAAVAAAATLALPVATFASPTVAAPPLTLVGTDTLSIVGKAGADEAKSSVFVVNEGGVKA